MQDKESNGDQEDEDSVEDVKHPLVSDDVAVVSLSILDHTDEVTNKDDGAAEVKVVHVFAPAQV